MVRTSWVAAVALTAAAVTAQPAFADDAVLTVGDLGGPAVDIGDSIAADATAGPTFTTAVNGNAGVTCAAASLVVSVTANPGAPGMATGSATALPFTDCVSTIPGCGKVAIAAQNLPYAADFSSVGTLWLGAGPNGPIRLLATCATPLGMVNCVFRPAGDSFGGTILNTEPSFVVASAAFPRLAGPAVCPAGLFLDVSYAQAQTAGQLVYLN
jgi:hypothetical protein